MEMGLAFLKGRVTLGVSHDVNGQVVRDCRSPSLLIPSALVPAYPPNLLLPHFVPAFCQLLSVACVSPVNLALTCRLHLSPRFCLQPNKHGVYWACHRLAPSADKPLRAFLSVF